MLIKCEYCDKEFNRKPSHVKRNKNNFCGKVCSDKWKIGKRSQSSVERIKHNCHYCSSEIKVKPSKYKMFLEGVYEDLFCNKYCLANWQRVSWKEKGSPRFKKRIEKICDHCDSEYLITQRKEENSRYCSSECRSSSKVVQIESKCNHCFKTFSRKPSAIGEKNFCDRKCYGEWSSQINSLKVEKICETCESSFTVHRNRSKSAKNCSKECHYKWLSEVYYKTEKGKAHAIKGGINSTLNQKYSNTKPERILKEFLIHEDIEYKDQYLMYDKFIVDFYIPEKNLVIEVFGDYWHANPKFYGGCGKPLTKQQEKQIKKDNSRKAYLEKCGHRFLIMWEDDIYNILPEIAKEI